MTVTFVKSLQIRKEKNVFKYFVDYFVFYLDQHLELNNRLTNWICWLIEANLLFPPHFRQLHVPQF